MADQVYDFLYSHSSYESLSSNFKACHYLAPWKHDKYPPRVIVKFIYCEENMEIFCRKSWLGGIRNPINGELIVLKESLPVHQKAIKDKAESEGLITTAYNGNVKGSHKNIRRAFQEHSIKFVKSSGRHQA